MTKTGAAGIAAAAASIVVATACSGSAAANRPKVEGSRPAASVATTAPLKVVATYDAKALGIKMAQALALGPDGNLYLTDASQRVVVVSPAGKPLRTWGGPGGEPGKFRFVANDPSDPTHLTARITVGPTGTVYVSDSGNHRVEAFTPAGNYVRAYGSPGQGLARFLTPFDLVADKAGNVYVADDQLETLSKVSPSGKLLWRIGGFTEKNSDLIGHMHLETIDGHGRLVVSVDEAKRILLVDEHGHVVEAFGDGSVLPDSSCDATVDAAGNIWTAGCGVNNGELLDRSHHQVARWSTVGGHDMETAPRWAPDGRGYFLSSDGTVVVVRSTVR